jgi:hypothetical protein
MRSCSRSSCWSCSCGAGTTGPPLATSGWLEAARKARFDEIVAPGGPAAARPGHGGIDDDEHLAAYNAYLARLNRPGGDGSG